MGKKDFYGFQVRVLQRVGDAHQEGEEEKFEYQPVKSIPVAKGYCLVVKRNQEFIIQITSTRPEVFGARLWIDDQEIFYKKTFKNKGYFMGFKLGQGKFKSFTFDSPVLESLTEQHTGGGHQELMRESTIRVQFYKTQLRYISSSELLKKSIRKAEDQYLPGIIKDNKKFFNKSLTVKPGDGTINQNYDQKRLFNKLKDRNSNRYRDYEILYTEPLETIVLGYGDFHSMLVKGYISLSNYEHFPCFPFEELIGSNRIAERILITIVRKHEPDGLDLDQIKQIFKENFQKDFDDLKVGTLSSFISLRGELFQVDDNYKLRTSEKSKNIFLDINDTKPEGKVVPKEYFASNIEKSIIDKKKGWCEMHKQSIRDENLNEILGKSIMSKEYEMIDLTEEE